MRACGQGGDRGDGTLVSNPPPPTHTHTVNTPLPYAGLRGKQVRGSRGSKRLKKNMYHSSKVTFNLHSREISGTAVLIIFFVL